MLNRSSLKARGASFQPPAPASFAGVAGKVAGDTMDFGPVKVGIRAGPGRQHPRTQ